MVASQLRTSCSNCVSVIIIGSLKVMSPPRSRGTQLHRPVGGQQFRLSRLRSPYSRVLPDDPPLKARRGVAVS